MNANLQHLILFAKNMLMPVFLETFRPRNKPAIRYMMCSEALTNPCLQAEKVWVVSFPAKFFTALITCSLVPRLTLHSADTCRQSALCKVGLGTRLGTGCQTSTHLFLMPGFLRPWMRGMYGLKLSICSLMPCATSRQPGISLKCFTHLCMVLHTG